MGSRGGGKLVLGSKKGITLVEMIVSVGLIALVSLALLGIIVPAVKTQAQARLRDEGAFKAARELEAKLYSMEADDHTDVSNASFISTGSHTLTFTVDGEIVECEGTLVYSKDPRTGTTVRAFRPDEPSGSTP